MMTSQKNILFINRTSFRLINISVLKLPLIFLCFLINPSQTLAQDQYATISLQRWNQKIVVSIQHDKGWHTYWKNPGDAGIPTSFDFNHPLNPYEWPTPHRYIEAGNILTIGYGGTAHFFFDEPSVNKALAATVKILICKDICIPGKAELKLSPNEKFTSNRHSSPYDDNSLKEAFQKLPKPTKLPEGFEFYVTRKKNSSQLTLHYSLKNVPKPDISPDLNFLTPFPHAPWGFKREKHYFKNNTLYGKTEIEWDGEYQDPPELLPATGEFSKPYELSFILNPPKSLEALSRQGLSIISLKVKNFSLSNETLEQFYKSLNSDPQNKVKSDQKTNTLTLLSYLLFAFVGGLILNLMPCVLPVISLKLFGLIKHQNLPQKKLITHQLSYSAGVIATLTGLATVITLIKMGGEEVGWGFQLQSPGFILFLMMVLFIMSLNLFGLFEFRTPGGSFLGQVQIKQSYWGDFFSGILTTILSTPCSAPFLGTALTFAFTTSVVNIYAIFIFIGLGLSFPFLMTGFFPRSLTILPKPGAWMEKLKYFLGLSLMLTFIWLYDVFVSLIHFELLSWRLNLLFLSWFFSFFLIKKMNLKRNLAIFIFLIPLSLSLLAFQNLELAPQSKNMSSSSQSHWIPWSEENLEKFKGQAIFMDFTAQWCITCKVNKKLVLDTEDFQKFANQEKLILLRGDWTRRDDSITQFLKKFQVVGVPAYFLQTKKGHIIHLGETISLKKLKRTLKIK